MVKTTVLEIHLQPHLETHDMFSDLPGKPRVSIFFLGQRICLEKVTLFNVSIKLGLKIYLETTESQSL